MRKTPSPPEGENLLMSLNEQIQTDRVGAMRNKETVRLGALRMAKAALTNKPVETGTPLSDEAVIAVLDTLVKQRRDSADQFRKGGRPEMAAKEEEEIAVIEVDLPAPATDDDIRAAIGAAIESTGAAALKDMGRVMRVAMAALAGKTVDGGNVSRRIREKLQA